MDPLTRKFDLGESEEGRSPKRARIDESSTEGIVEEKEQDEYILPPSHVLLGSSAPSLAPDGSIYKILETDVGISEYIARDVPKISGIIKQRFTDFLVYEVDLDYNVIHLRSLDMPESSGKKDREQLDTSAVTAQRSETEPTGKATAENFPVEWVSTTEQNLGCESIKPPNSDERYHKGDEDKLKNPEPTDPWPDRFNETLRPFLSSDGIEQIKKMFLEGPKPPRVSDSGWGGRQAKVSEAGSSGAPDDAPELEKEDRRGKSGRGRGGRNVRGGRGGGRVEDTRKVLSNPIPEKATRTTLHQVIRELFGGKLESETAAAAPGTDEGSRIAIKWSHGGMGRDSRRGGRGGGGDRAPRGTYPPYIHFTLQKTNRDTQDALVHLSRILHVNIKDLSTAGTKDKRAVTVQRVALKRNNKTVEDVWRLANGQTGRKTKEEAVSSRGERGIRIADLNYRKSFLELGMLKGNAFVITLRNVQLDSVETLDRALNSLKHKGFINYYGMQRFGTASIPTHSIGLALLLSDWHRAISLILRKRPGEHPDVEAARNAWLVDGDLDRALELLPRRVVAERCILESFKKQKGDTRNAMGALSTIPRNLRLMYVHAYQSYVWNAIVSERIRVHGSDKPIVGDLVFDTGNTADQDIEDVSNNAAEEETPDTDDRAEVVNGAEEMDVDEPVKAPALGKSRRNKPWEPPKVKTLTEANLDKHSIFDVIMPLPGTDVAYPGGQLGERYREYLRVDGLDPDNFIRKQKEYTLTGSYRKILQLPRDLSWKVMRYTDPDVALAQADEDKLLGFDPPVINDEGKFMALQIELTLGTAAYATMALREVTKTETSSYFQSNLTQVSEDQTFKATGKDDS